ncbi:energy-coupling factor transporter transmembrane protein EcfT [Aeromicrobium sp. A1-2]|uniref:energy-coupling factor transporter transmembrane component T family protein n=1 Tax=Aeromicrobium sp. A1-2 TaxID=2107713 RepID=UPI000E4E5FFA|nr:energy-coupling factor transporter transmembrane protein EcfT [Aeromicrobium sp. A1-2]AXT86230.1 energy-coupling factor transporter transmembrane protein EcfT [Aeromicrobium sp. A1-2]
MSQFLLGNYRPGSTWVHRFPTGPKLACLAIFSIATVVVPGMWTAVAFLGAALLLAAWTRMPLRGTLRALRPLLLVIALVSAFQVWQRGWPTAIHVVAGLVAVIVVALVFTATTSIDSMLDTITRGLGPFRPIGVNPERVALAFSLMIRAIPGILEIAHETRAAARARGLERSPRALLVPMAIRTVAHAYDTGAALHARGIGDD